jgi:hypothetical protein
LVSHPVSTFRRKKAILYKSLRGDMAIIAV